MLAELNSRTTVLIERAGLRPIRTASIACEHWACDSVVLSRLPIVEDLSDWLGDHRVATSAARIATPFGPFAVAGVHLDRPLPPRRLQRQEHQVDGLVDTPGQYRQSAAAGWRFQCVAVGTAATEPGTQDRARARLGPGGHLAGTSPLAVAYPDRSCPDRARPGAARSGGRPSAGFRSSSPAASRRSA